MLRLQTPIWLILGVMCCTWSSSKGQGEVSIGIGLSNYQGDLPSYNFNDGLKICIGPVIGVHGGYEINRHFQARTDLLYLRLSGDDALGDKQDVMERNLDFFAPVIQLAAGMDWNLLGFQTSTTGDFTPYASAGASLFYFNPRTKYQGEKVSLQPLGTEGQYLSDYPDQKPYSRFQASLQLGGGLKWMPKDNLILALEGMLSITFTDYLDDASTIYISYPELLEKAGPLTAALANRSGEYLGTEPVVVPTGAARANRTTRDLFGVMTIRAGMPITIGTNQFKVRRHNSKTIPNPKF